MKNLYSKFRFYLKAYRRLELMNKAASLSYYTIISLFPLILILATVLTHVLSQQVVVDIITGFFNQALPYQSDLVMNNIRALFVKKRAFSWFGAIALIVSAQILYVNFERIVNGILHAAKKRHFLLTRVLFLLWLVGIVFALFAPVGLELLSIWVLKLGFHVEELARLSARGGFMLVGFLVFWLMLALLPTRRLKTRRVLAGATLFALSLQLGKFVFKWFTLKNLDRYNLIYGSLSTMVLGTLWVFYFYNLFLFFVYWVGREHDPHYQRGC